MFSDDPLQPNPEAEGSWFSYSTSPDQPPVPQQQVPQPNWQPSVPPQQLPTRPDWQTPQPPTVPQPGYPPIVQQQVPQPGWQTPYPPVYQMPQYGQATYSSTVARNTRSRSIFILTCVVVIVFALGLFSGWELIGTHTSGTTTSVSTTTSSSTPDQVSNTSAETAQEAVIAKVSPAIVEIDGTTSQGQVIGSGIIIDSKGDIVTNDHVVSGTNSLSVLLSNGTSETAQIVGTNTSADLAVLHITPFTGMIVAVLADSSQLVVGEDVLAIGSPLGYTGTVTAGVVSALNRTASESQTVNLTGLIQTSAAINPGNSGGALVNLQGQVVGMPTLSAINNETNTPANGLGFAISSNQIKTITAQILAS